MRKKSGASASTLHVSMLRITKSVSGDGRTYAEGDMDCIEEDEVPRVESVVRQDFNTRATEVRVIRSISCIVDLDDDMPAVIHIRQARRARLVHVVDMPCRRVGRQVTGRAVDDRLQTRRVPCVVSSYEP